MERRKRRPQKSVSETCPKCGYCDKCGRSNAAPVWPVTPYVPYWNPNYWPYYNPYAIGISGTSGTIAVTSGGSASAQPAYSPSVYNVSGLPFSAGIDLDSIKFDDSGTLTSN